MRTNQTVHFISYGFRLKVKDNPGRFRISIPVTISKNKIKNTITVLQSIQDVISRTTVIKLVCSLT